MKLSRSISNPQAGSAPRIRGRLMVEVPLFPRDPSHKSKA